VTDLGNDAGDDFGKSPQEDPGSTNLFLGDADGKCLGDEYGKRFSPDFSGLMKWWFSWSMRGFSGDDFGNYRVLHDF